MSRIEVPEHWLPHGARRLRRRRALAGLVVLLVLTSPLWLLTRRDDGFHRWTRVSDPPPWSRSWGPEDGVRVALLDGPLDPPARWRRTVSNAERTEWLGRRTEGTWWDGAFKGGQGSVMNGLWARVTTDGAVEPHCASNPLDPESVWGTILVWRERGPEGSRTEIRFWLTSTEESLCVRGSWRAYGEAALVER